MQKKIETAHPENNAAYGRNLKEKTELLKLLEHQSIFKYGEETELIKGLGEIADFYLPSWIVGTEEVCKSLVYAFLYGAMTGVRHERKKRKEKACRIAEVPVVTYHMMTDEEWKRLAYKNQIEREGGVA